MLFEKYVREMPFYLKNIYSKTRKLKTSQIFFIKSKNIRFTKMKKRILK